jgi:molybdopterin-guanine dinucleotide biosynthesis protein A
VVVRDGEGLQPLVALWPVASARTAVADALAAGELAVHPLARLLGLAVLDLSPGRLGNLNTPADFE